MHTKTFSDKFSWISKIKKHPQSFFPISDKGTVDTSSLIQPLIQSAFDGYCFELGSYALVEFCNGYCTFLIEGGRLLIEKVLGQNVPDDFEGEAGMFDWVLQKLWSWHRGTPNLLLPFQGIAYSVLASELCIVDISTTTSHFQQGFYYGKPITPCNQYILEESFFKTGFIRLHFVPSREIFQQRNLKAKDITRSLNMLQEIKATSDQVQIQRIEESSCGIRAIFVGSESHEKFSSRLNPFF